MKKIKLLINFIQATTKAKIVAGIIGVALVGTSATVGYNYINNSTKTDNKGTIKTDVKEDGTKVEVKEMEDGTKIEVKEMEDGTKVETEIKPDGSKIETEIRSDGTKVEVKTSADGTKTETETKPDGTKIIKDGSNSGNNNSGNNNSGSGNNNSGNQGTTKPSGIESDMTNSYNSRYEKNYTGVKASNLNDIVNKLASGAISQSDVNNKVRELGTWDENNYNNAIDSVQVTVNETSSSDVSSMYSSFHKNFTTDSQHTMYTRAAIFYDASAGKYRLARVGFSFARATIVTQPEQPQSPYYAAHPKTTGYNQALTNIYNQYFGENKYSGVKSSDFNKILLDLASGSISADEARNRVNAVGNWEENGKRYYVYSCVIDQLEYNSDDAKELHDKLNKTPASQQVAYINTGILYKSQFIVNRVFRLVVNISPQQ